MSLYLATQDSEWLTHSLSLWNRLKSNHFSYRMFDLAIISPLSLKVINFLPSILYFIFCYLFGSLIQGILVIFIFSIAISEAIITLRSFFKCMCAIDSSEFQKLKFQVAKEPSWTFLIQFPRNLFFLLYVGTLYDCGGLTEECPQ